MKYIRFNWGTIQYASMQEIPFLQSTMNDRTDWKFGFMKHDVYVYSIIKCVSD